MARASDSFSLNLDLEKTMRVCREAVATLDWSVLGESAKTLTCKTKMAADHWRFNVEIELKPEFPDLTVVSARGSAYGWMSRTSRLIAGELGKFRNQCEVLQVRHLDTVRPTPMELSLADELERIASLHARGVLSDTEFAAAKARLVNPG